MEYQNNVSLGKKFAVVRDQVVDGKDEMQTLTWRVGSDYITFPYCIASCNTFLKKGEDCVPAEIGITKFSFRDGILEKYHSLIDPSNTIPDYELPDVIEYAVDSHQIPYDAKNFPDIRNVIADIYAFTHTYDVNGKKTAYIFAEFDEMEKIKYTFKWFENRSNEYQMNLSWQINFISLRTLFLFLISHIPVTNLDDSDAFSAFKKGSYDYTDLCAFHLQLRDCRFCAISQAFIYCYILSEHFSEPFGVDRLVRINFTGSFKKYVRDL